MDSIDIMLTNMANTMILEGTIVLDECRVREDLMGLYQDIRLELRQKAPGKENMIYSYADLLQKELELFTPRMAYEAGTVLGCNPQGQDSDPERAYMRYICRVGLVPAAQQMQREIGGMYNEIIENLDDTYSLINDFTDLYKKCHGIICSRIYDFFRLGYDTMSQASPF